MPLYVKEIRGVVNSEIVNEFASNLGTSIGNFLGSCSTVVVGRDMGDPSQMIKRSISSGLMAAGINVLDFGIAPIPAINYGKELYGAKAVVTVTASHIRPDDITIKIFSDHDIPLEQRHIERVHWNDIGRLTYVHDYKEAYTLNLLDNIDVELIKSRFPKIVIDCVNGIMTSFTPATLLNKLECETIITGSDHSGKIYRFPQPSPETLSLICELVKTTGSDMGIAIDNDRDRVVFIDETGNILRDQTVLAIFAREALKENPGGVVVTSVVASMSLDEVVSENNGKLIKSALDFVLNDTLDENAIFGGDEPGMYVFPQVNMSFDAIYASIKMLEIICKSGKTLSNLAADIKEYHRNVFSVECEHTQKAAVIDSLKKYYEGKGDLTLVDGFRVDLGDSIVIVRPSRFDPLIRVYLEAKSPEKLQILIQEVNKLI